MHISFSNLHHIAIEVSFEADLENDFNSVGKKNPQIILYQDWFEGTDVIWIYRPRVNVEILILS